MNAIYLLAVDDKPANLLILKETIAENLSTCHLLTAGSMREGLFIAANKKVDCIIADLQMPQTDGIDMCANLKRDERTAHIPILLVADPQSRRELLVRGLEAGADDYISKPIGAVELIAKIKVLLRVKKAEDELRSLNARLDESLDERTKALQKSERRFRSLFTEIHEGFALHEIICDDSGAPIDYRFLEINPAFERLTGLKADEIQGKTVLEVLPNTESYWIQTYGQVALTGKPAHFENYSQEIDRYYRVVAYSPQKNQFAVIFEDTTERKLAEKILRESEEKFSKSFRRAPALMTISTLEDGTYLDVNDKFTEAYGASREEIIGKTSLELGWIRPEDRQRIAQLIREKGSANDIELSLYAKDGRKVDCLYDGELITIDERTRLLSIAVDITERKKAENALIESEKQYRSLFNNMLNGFAYCRMIFEGDRPQDFVYLAVNSAFESLTGLKNVSGKKVSEVIPGIRESDTELFEVYGKVALTGKPERFEQYLNALNMWFSVSLYSPQKEYFVAVFDVITERKKYEEERETTLKLLQLLNADIDAHALIQLLTGYLQQWSGCEAVGVRLREGDDYPYFETKGFPPQFVNAENHLCQYDRTGERIRDAQGNPVLECMCGNILCGRVDPKLECFTQGGSFWTNSTTDLLASTSKEDRPAQTRNRCNGEGYESVALIPLKTGNKTMGLLQLNDRRKDRFTLRSIEFFERTAHNIAIALEQRITHAKLRESESRFEQVAESANEWIWEVDREGLYVYSSSAIERILGYSPRELVKKKHFYDLFIPEERNQLKESALGMFQRKESFQRFVNRNVHKNGSTVILETSGIPILDRNGNLRGYRGTDSNITERKRAEDALQEQIHLNKTFLDSMPCVALLMNMHTRTIVAANAAAAQAGCTPGKQCYQSWIKRDAPCPWCLAPELWATGTAHHTEIKHGETIWDAHWLPVSKDLYLHYAFDITEKRQLEMQFLHVQKMEAIGTLAGGIAHDFNNILAGIIGFTQLSLGECGDTNGVLREHLETILEAGLRARQLVQQILAFSRKSDMEKKPFQIASMVKEGLKLLRSTLPSTIEIRQNVEAESASILGNATQIHQVFMNLCTNASHAMRESGGVLDVSLREIEWEEIDAVLPYFDLKPGNYVCLQIKDTGGGIDPTIQQRIFEPFFTTKNKADGTGLGLSVVLGIVKHHNGAMSMESQFGEGTTFSVYLPPIAAFDDFQEIYKEERKGNGERILLVDDEIILIKLGKRMLESLGYRVSSHTNSEEALEAFRRDPTSYDLVLSDLTMPKMTGIQLAREINKIRSDIAILVYTGYNEKIFNDDAKRMGIREILSKPLTKYDLATACAKHLKKSV